MNSLQPNRFSIRDIATALGEGWRCFLAMPGPSVAFAALFVLIGAPLLAAVGLLGVSPLILPLAGGFVLLGPSLLAGFFELVRVHASGARPRALNALDGFLRAPGGLWLVVAVCAFLFLIWITVLLAIGLKVIGKIPMSKALVAAVLVWLVAGLTVMLLANS